MDDSGFQSVVAWAGAVSGVTTVVLVGRDETGTQADSADASRLASSFGLDWVVVDPAASLVNPWADSAPPKTYLIDAEMQIYWTYYGTVAQTQVEDKIDDMGG